MDENTENILNRINEIYSLKGLKEETRNILGFSSIKNLQNLEEIGRDELFRHNLQKSTAKFSHVGIITRPSKKATVLVIGNHSAGKSSFINWYVGEKIQSTGIGIETSHFTMITHGEKSSELRSEGTMTMYPFFREIMNYSDKKVYGTFFSNLTTKISNKDEKNFKFVDFIDTPGLTDGNVSYNCDIIEMMKWISNYVDLVLVFLDPIGQALCLKTMEMIDFLLKTHPNKVKICLTKIDQIDSENDYNKLNLQIYSGISLKTGGIHFEIIPFTIKTDLNIKNNTIKVILEVIENASKTKALSNIETLTNDCYFILNHAAAIKSNNKILISKNKLKSIFEKILIFVGVVLGISVYNDFGDDFTMNYFDRNTKLIGLVLIFVVLVFLLTRKSMILSSNQLERLENWVKYTNQALEEAQKLTSEYFSE